MSGPRPPQRDLSHLSREEKAQLFEKLRRKKELAASQPGRLTPLPPLIRRPEGAGPPPLSIAQERLWVLASLAPGDPAATLEAALQLEGTLHLPPLEGALRAAAARHEVLRLRVGATSPAAAGVGGAGQPVQLVAAEDGPALPVVDLAALAGERQAEETERLRTAAVSRPFDLASAPPLRAGLLRLAPDRHLLLLACHRIAADERSLEMLIAELALTYRALAAGTAGDARDAGGAGEPPRLPALPVRYGDFAAWQRAWLAGPAGAERLAWWRRQLGGDRPAPVEALVLPADRSRPARRTSTAGSCRLELCPEAAGRLHGLATGGTPLLAVLLAGLAALLARYSQQEEIWIGVPVANRDVPETAPLVGPVANLLVLKADLSADPAPRELISRLREATLGALGHQEVPFELLLAELSPEREPSRPPLFQVALSLAETPALPSPLTPLDAVRLPGLTLSRAPGTGVATGLDLAISFAPLAGGGLELSVVYSRDLFDRPTCQRLASHLAMLLHGLAGGDAGSGEAGGDGTAGQAGERVSSLLLLAPSERHQLVREWNDTAGPAPAGTVLDWIEAQAVRHPEAPALVALPENGPESGRPAPSPAGGAAGGAIWTYAELDARANRLAHHLRALGIGAESLVGVRLPRSAEAIAAFLAVLKAGAAYVPIDPAYPAERQAFMTADARLSALIDRGGNAPASPAGAAAVIDLDRDAAEIAGRPCQPPARPALAGLLAYVIYTSGSTGRPKGVAVDHRTLAHSIRAFSHHHPAPVTSFLLLSSIGFDSSVPGIYWTLGQGGTLVLPPAQFHLELARVAEALVRQRVSHLLCLPWLYRLLLEEIPAGGAPALTTVVVAGEQCPATLVGRHFEHLPGVALFNDYGPTETTVWCSCFDCSRLGGARVVPIGRPIIGLRLHLLDGAGQPVPLGAVGELHAGGDGIARGYPGLPDTTAERFLPDPWSEAGGERLYRTGDRARLLPGGDIELLGRCDSQVKVRGFRVELGEVEHALVALPDLRAAAVVAHQTAAGDVRLIAYVVPRAGRQPTAGGLRAALRARLPEQMLPASFETLAELPLTATGKLDRQALAARPLAALPLATAERHPEARPASIDDAIQEEIAAIWREVLGLSELGVHDNFFDLGGHSLLLVVAHGKLRNRFPGLTVLDLFRFPTIAALAGHLRPAGEPGASLFGGAGEIGERSALGAPGEAGGFSRASHPEPDGGEIGDIAVVGMSGRFPGAATVEELWSNLLAGVESIKQLSDEDLARAKVSPAQSTLPAYVRASASLEGADLFDAGFFGFTPREAESTDPQHRLLLECAWEALESAGYDPASFPGRIGVYAGAGASGYEINIFSHRQMVEALGNLRLQMGLDKDYLATRIAYKLDLKGPAVAVQTACSTALVAVHMACRALAGGECEMAIAGAASVRNFTGEGYIFEEGGISSPDGHCRTFDAAARGTVAGDGVALVVLKPKAAALADGDTIHAVIKGSAINNDGAQKVGYTAPSVAGQAAVVLEAQRVAGVEASTIDFVEAHGTATYLGDPIEVAALTQVFSQARQGSCALGSVKTNLGHLDAAAGVAGLLKAVYAVREGVIPPTLHFERASPALSLDTSPFYVNNTLMRWPPRQGPRRAGVSSFGVGGTNAHAIVEQPPEPAATTGESGPFLLLLSARSTAALERAGGRLADHLAAHPELDLADVSYTLRVGRRAFDQRRAVLAEDHEGACRALRGEASSRVLSAPAAAVGAGGTPGEVAFLFPGQGAQHPGMGAHLYREQPVYREEIDQAAEVLRPHLGLDLRELLAPPPGREAWAAEQLGRTRYTQPALFAVEHAMARLWQSWGVRPSALLGHSVGEYVAACLAGVLTRDDALALVALRGRLIDELPAGAMLSVPLPAAEVAGLLGGEVSVAAVNAADRTVVSGTEPAILELERGLVARGVQARRLATSHAFHSAMMEPAVAALSRAFARVPLQTPKLRYLSNVSGTWIRPHQATDPAYWGRHLRQPVRFAEGLGELVAGGAGVLLEVGPGETLSRLARRELRRRREDPAPLVLSTAAEKPATAAPQPEPQTRREAGEAEGSSLASSEACDPREVGEAREPQAAREAREPQETREARQKEHLLRTVARLWLVGLRLAPTAGQAASARRRVPLPSYAFERRRYWIEANFAVKPATEMGAAGEGAGSFAELPPVAPSGEAGEDGTSGLAPGASPPADPRARQELADWFYLPSWERSLPPPPVGDGRQLPEGGFLLLLSEDGGTGSTGPIAAGALDAGGAAGTGGDGGRARQSPGLAAALERRLRAAGRPLATCGEAPRFTRLGPGRYALDPGSAADHEALLDALAADGFAFETVIDLRNAGQGPQAGDAGGTVAETGLARAIDRAFYAPLFLARALARRGDTERRAIWCIARHLHDIAGGEEVWPERALCLGPVRVVPLELPNLAWRCLELAPVAAGLPGAASEQEPAWAERILAEVAARSSETVIAYRGRQRWVPVFTPAPLPAAPSAAGEAGGAVASPPLRRGGIYLLTGGLGGIGEALARHLAGAAGARLVLVQRTPLPAREEWEGHLAAAGGDALARKLRRLRRLEAEAERAGGEVLVLAADVTRPDDLERVRKAVAARWGSPVHGIVHAAGLPGAGLVFRKERAEAAAVLGPKVLGTLALARAFPPAQLDFFVLCSSLTTAFGFYGQADYVAANAFQEAFAQSRGGALRAVAPTSAAAGAAPTAAAIGAAPAQPAAGAGESGGPAGRVLAIAWDAWIEAGMAVETLLPRALGGGAGHTAAEGQPGIASAEGMEAFQRILARVDLPQVAVSVRPIATLRAEARARDAAALLTLLGGAAAAGERHDRPDLGSPYEAPRNEVEAQLAAIWQELLGLAEVGIHDDFFELGGDSVLGLRIVARARERGLILVPGQIFEHPTIAALAARIGAEGLQEPPAAALPEAPATATPPGAGATAGPLSPDDFPDAEVSARDLEMLIAQLGGREGG